MDLAISLATGCAGIAPTHIAPGDDDDDDDDEDDDDDDEPEVLSAARHAQHDQPGQTHARQPANDYHSVSLFLFISVIVYLCHCLSLSLFIFQIHPCHLFAF